MGITLLLIFEVFLPLQPAMAQSELGLYVSSRLGIPQKIYRFGGVPAEMREWERVSLS